VTEPTELSTVILGMKPYLLAEFTPVPPESPDDLGLAVKIATGGGLTHSDLPDVVALLGEQFRITDDDGNPLFPVYLADGEAGLFDEALVKLREFYDDGTLDDGTVGAIDNLRRKLREGA
jgi:hypothetical protein